MSLVADHIWKFSAPNLGPKLCISTGVHGNERSPIDAGELLRQGLESGELKLQSGELLCMVSNPKAAAIDQRWSEGGIDLNRCFHPTDMKKAPSLYEEHRVHEIANALTEFQAECLVDFHCTVEPGEQFLMQHPRPDDTNHAAIYRWLRGKVLLADPRLNFGGVSLDEWMSTRDRVGICYETGWIHDPANRKEDVYEEMLNLLRGLGMLEGTAVSYQDKRLLELQKAQLCESEGFTWANGIGQNLQTLPAGTVLGRYANGNELVIDEETTLIFPKKKRELLRPGKPMVYLAATSKPT